MSPPSVIGIINVVDDPKPTWELDISVMNILKTNMYLQCNILSFGLGNASSMVKCLSEC